MKLLIATPYFSPKVGGLENYAHSLALELIKLGWEVIVVCGYTNSGVTKTTLDGLTVYRLPIFKTVSNTPINLRWYRMLRHIIKTEKPHIINAHTPVPFMVDMVLLAAGKTPVVVTYHAATLLKPSSVALKTITALYMRWEKLILTRSRRIVAVSPYVRSALEQRFERSIDLVTNAVTKPHPMTKSARNGLVFVANLEPTHSWKGLDLILDSLQSIKTSGQPVPRLTIVGDGSSRSHYEKRVTELGLSDKVVFAGRVTGSARDAVMNQAAALIAYPTTANDAFPTVFLEAWALGLPVIAAAIGPIPSLIKSGETGILVESGNAETLAQALVQAMPGASKLRRMGATGHGLVVSEYNWTVQAAKMSTLLKATV
jgi:glycosyltransferase involved in cell wall biosynthesis